MSNIVMELLTAKYLTTSLPEAQYAQQSLYSSVYTDDVQLSIGLNHTYQTPSYH